MRKYSLSDEQRWIKSKNVSSVSSKVEKTKNMTFYDLKILYGFIFILIIWYPSLI